MVQAHSGSSLGLSGDFILPVDFQDIYFPFYWNEVSGRGHEPELSISTIVPDAKFGQAIAVEDSTTNILGPSATSASGWSGVHGITVTDIGDYIEAKVTNLSALTSWGGECRVILNPAIVDGKTVSFSMEHVIVDNITSGSVRLFMEDNQNSNWQATDYFFPRNGVYIKPSITRNCRTGLVSSLVSFRFTASINLGARVLFKKPQLEEKAWATSFTESSRGSGALSYPKELLNPSAFTINTWVKRNRLGPSTYNPIVDICSSNHQNNRLLLMYHGTGTLQCWIGNNTMNTSFHYAHAKNARLNEWQMVTLTYNGSFYSLYVDGVLATEHINQPLSFHHNATINIGGRHWGTLNGQLSGFLIRPYATRPEEIKAWYDYGKQLYDPYDYSATWG